MSKIDVGHFACNGIQPEPVFALFVHSGTLVLLGACRSCGSQWGSQKHPKAPKMPKAGFPIRKLLKSEGGVTHFQAGIWMDCIFDILGPGEPLGLRPESPKT